MEFAERIATVTYKVFARGEVVKPVSPWCVLPPGIYTVRKFTHPAVPYELDGTVFVEEHKYGISAEYLTSAEEE